MEQKPNKPHNKKDNEPDIERLIEELKESIGGSDKVKVEVVRVKASPITLKNRIYYFLINFLLSLVVLTSLSGFIKWFEINNIINYISFVVFFSILEEISKLLILQFVPSKIITQSFGSIIWLSTVFAFIIAMIFTPGFYLINSNPTIILFFSFMIIRGFFNKLLTHYRIQRKIKKVKKIDSNITKGE